MEDAYGEYAASDSDVVELNDKVWLSIHYNYLYYDFDYDLIVKDCDVYDCQQNQKLCNFHRHMNCYGVYCLVSLKILSELASYFQTAVAKHFWSC